MTLYSFILSGTQADDKHKCTLIILPKISRSIILVVGSAHTNDFPQMDPLHTVQSSGLSSPLCFTKTMLGCVYLSNTTNGGREYV